MKTTKNTRKFHALLRRCHTILESVAREGRLDLLDDYRKTKESAYRLVNRCDESREDRDNMLDLLGFLPYEESIVQGRKVRDLQRAKEHAELVRLTREAKTRPGTYEFELEVMRRQR